MHCKRCFPCSCSRQFFLLAEKSKILETYKCTALLRDGAYGQINAGPQLHTWAEGKNHNLFFCKTSAGCSMSEATNDLGHMHDALHKQFSGFHFKSSKIQLPPGANYAAANAHLKSFLSTESYNTYFRLLCFFESFMFKAFNPMSVRSALLQGGFDGIFFIYLYNQ